MKSSAGFFFPPVQIEDKGDWEMSSLSQRDSTHTLKILDIAIVLSTDLCGQTYLQTNLDIIGVELAV